LEKLANLEK